MAELPERKVLKKILGELKAKTIRSKSEVHSSTENLINMLSQMREDLSKAKEIFKSENGKTTATDLVYTYVDNMSNWTIALIRDYLRVMDDMSLYEKSLEEYSIELDKTLYDAIEEGKRKAEEQIKEQSELMSKKKDAYVD